MRIFISSTTKGLSDERRILDNALTTFGKSSGIEIVIQRFEDWGEAQKKGQNAMDACFERMRDCDYCIILLGGFYGTRPKGYDFSATELEFNLTQKLSDCKIIVLEKAPIMFTKKDQKLLNSQSDADKKDYERFKKKVINKYQKFFVIFNDTNELQIRAISAIAREINSELSSKTNLANEIEKHLSHLNESTSDFIKMFKTIETKPSLICRIYEISRAIKLAQSLENDNMVITSIRRERRDGILAKAKELADLFIDERIPNFSKKNTSYIPKSLNAYLSKADLSKENLDLLCYIFLERGLISRYEHQYKESLKYHKVCEYLCDESCYGISNPVKQRVFEVVSSTYLFIGNISYANTLADRAEKWYDMLGSKAEQGAESRLSFLKAIIKVANKDKDALDELSKAGKIYSDENNCVGITLCDLWQAIYYNSIGNKDDAKKVLDDFNKKGYRFMIEKDEMCKFIWNGAKEGNSYEDLFFKQ